MAAQLTDAWRDALFSEAGEAALRRYYTFHLEGITKISDALPAARSVQLDRLTRHLLGHYGRYLDENTRLPESYRLAWITELSPRIFKLEALILGAAAPKDLKTCLCNAVKHAAGHTLREQRYLEQLLDALEKISWEASGTAEAVRHCLLLLNFNHLAYLACLQREVRAHASGLPEEARQAFLRSELGRLRAQPLRSGTGYDPDWPPLAHMLCAFLEEELRALPPGAPAPEKLALNLSVAQLAGMIRLGHQQGLFGDKNLSEIFRFMAASFSTKRQGQISPGSLSKEYYGTTQVTAAVLRDQLSQMVKNIDRDFFPK